MDAHKQTIVFNKSDGSFWFMGDVLPSNYNVDEHVIEHVDEDANDHGRMTRDIFVWIILRCSKDVLGML